jgi:hypothetical protein
MYSPKRRFRLFRDPAFTGGGDKIAEALTTSLSSYTSASDGSWVKITSAEYTTLQTKVSGTSLAGTTAVTYSAIGTSTNFTTGSLIFTNIVGAATPAIPANSYVYAIAFYFNGNNSQISVYANDSVSSYTNFSKIGGTLPTTTAGDNYYVLKGSSSVTAATNGNLAMWSNDNVKHGFKQSISASGARYTTTATPTTSTTLSSQFLNSAAFSLQGLTTTTKQW